MMYMRVTPQFRVNELLVREMVVPVLPMFGMPIDRLFVTLVDMVTFGTRSLEVSPVFGFFYKDIKWMMDMHRNMFSHTQGI